MSITKFSARKATVKYSVSAVTFDASTALNAESYATTVASIKNLTIELPKSDLEQVPLLGETAQVIGGNVPVGATHQNAFMDEKNWSNAKFSGTLVLRGDEDFEALVSGTGTAISGGSTRYSLGDSASGKTRVVVGAMLFDLYNGSERYSCVFCNVYLNLTKINPTGADGHWEIEVEGECLPEGFAYEFLD